MKRTLIAAMILVCAAGAYAQKSDQGNPALERGLHPEKLYQFNDFDNVSIYNGNLGIALPIGPAYAVDGGLTYQLKLRYNSKFWDFDRSPPTENGNPWIFSHAYPSRASNAGIGWSLGFGRFIEATDPNGPGKNAYEAPDGGEHPFDALPWASTNNTTTDGTNLRYRSISANEVEIDFPDGVVQKHVRNADASWSLTEIRAPRGNGKIEVATIPIPSECGAPADYVTAWKISDTEFRKHYVCFQTFLMDDQPRAMVTKVVFEAVPDQPRMTYSMAYGDKNDVGWAPGEADFGDTENAHDPWRTLHEVKVLESVTLPDDSRWEFAYTRNQPYVTAVTLPTKARILYEYGGLPVADDYNGSRCPQPQPQVLPSAETTEGVTMRTVIPAVPAGAATVRYEWKYDRELSGPQSVPAQTCMDPLTRYDEMIATVTDPAGAVVESHFTMWTGDNPQNGGPISERGFNNEHYSLPWGKYDPTQLRYLSQVHRACEGCPPLRTTYVRHDIVPDSFKHPTFRRFPTHRLASQAVYDHGCIADESDVDCTGPRIRVCTADTPATRCPFTATESTDWDDFAHYRTITTSTYGFANAAPTGTKTVTTNWNEGRSIATNQPWVLDYYDERTTAETGKTTITEQVCIALGAYIQKNDEGEDEYPAGRGFLRGKRLLAGSTPGENDLITQYLQNPEDSNPSGERYYGGDKTPLIAAAASAATACDALALLDGTTPAFATKHTFELGQMKTSQHVGATFLSLDLDLHASGVATTSRDTTGLPTGYLYDKAGRIKTITPPDGAATSYEYDNASALWNDEAKTNLLLQPAKALQRTPSASGNVESHYEFDSLGRVAKEKKLLPNNEFLRSEHTYDGLGRKTSSTVWGTGSNLKSTRFIYDPTGRTTAVIAPDDEKVAFEYTGSQFKTRIEKIWDGTQDREARTKEEYDGFGRLVKVTEQSGEPTASNPNGNVVTEYGYNAADQLVSVKINGNQERTFGYDGRGLLSWEDHPEANKTSYTYDARGHVVSRSITGDTKFDLKFDYDSSERLITVSERDPGTTGFRLLKELQFADENDEDQDDWRRGKLWKAKRHNYAPVDPLLDSRQDKIVVEETYAYRRAGGRKNERSTKITSYPSPGIENVLSEFNQSTHFNELELPDVITYPSCFMCGVPERNTVTTHYKNGRIDRLSEAVKSITYSSNGTWHQRERTSGITDVQEPDPDGMPRPLSIGVNVPPVCDLIAGEPLSQSVAPGSPVTFSVTVNENVSGAAFQWYRGPRGDTRHGIAGAASSSLTLTSVTATTSYWVRVTAGGCSEDSQTATVDVCNLIADQPDPVTVLENQPAMLTVVANPSGATFQWYKGLRGDKSNPLPDETAATLQIPTVTATSTYWVQVKHNGCTQDSQDAKVTMCAPFTIVNPPAGVAESEVIKNVPLTFTVEVTGDLLSYSWFEGTGPTRKPLGKGLQITYTPQATTTAGNPIVIEVEVTNGCTTQTRTAARLNVNAELRPCVADITIAPAPMYQTIRPNEQLIIDITSRLKAESGSDYTDIQYLFKWYEQGAVVHSDVEEGVTKENENYESASSDYLVRFVGQTSVRVDAWLLCKKVTATGTTTTITSPVVTHKSFAFQYGHCPVPDVVSVPATAVLRGTDPVTLKADSIYPWATFKWYAGESGNAREELLQSTAETLAVSVPGTYWVRAFSECGEHSDSPTVIVSKDGTGGVCTPVRIQADPQEKSVAAFAPLTLTVTASSVPPPTKYRWSTSPSSNVDGQYTATMSINPGPRKTTDYTAYVENSCSSVYSRPARVHVTSCADMTIHVQPEDDSIPAGDVASLTIQATAAGSAQLYYQWYEGESGDTRWPVGGLRNTPQYDDSKHGPTLDLGTPTASKRYWVRVSFNDETKCEVDSRTATISVCATPAITNAPTNRNSMAPGLDQSFSVGATGESLSYAWYEGSNTNDESKLLSTTPGLLVYPSLTTDYYVKVTSDCVPDQADRSIKSAFRISVCPDFRGDETPTATKTLVTAGTTTTLTVDVHRGDVIEWYKVVGNAAPVKFAEGPGMSTVTTPAIDVETSFFARARSGNCSQDSARITIAVCSSPRIHWSSTPGQVAKNASFWLTTGLGAGETASFKWYRGAVAGDVANSTLVYSSSGSYQVSGLAATTSYWVRATNESTGCYSDTTVHTVNVCTPTIITQPPASVMVNPNANTTLTVTTDNLPGVSYQWYTGQPGNTSSPVPNGASASITVAPAANTTYWVQVKGCPSPLSPVTVNSEASNVTICKVPAITADLTPKESARNVSMTLTVTATGDGLHYQWYEGAANVTTTPVGTDSNSYTFTTSVSKRFWVRVTGTCGTPVVSAAPLVSVQPLISTQPASATVTKGTTRTLTVASATGTELRYEWYQRIGATSTLMSGTTSSPSFPTPAINENSTFYAKVFSGTVSTLSNDAVLTLCAVSTVSSTATSSQMSGAVVRLSVDSPGTGETYQWYRGNSGDTTNPIVNATASMVDLYPAETTNYWVRTTRATCHADSATKTVNVCRPAITTQPVSKTVTKGTPTTLTVAGTGTGTLSYEWFIGTPGGANTLIAGANTATLSGTPTETNTYFARITSSSACSTRSTDSAVATVTVCTPPGITTDLTPKELPRDYDLTLSIAASGDGLHYQWYEGNVNDTSTPVGTDSNSYRFNTTVTKRFWVRVTGSCGTAVNSSAPLVSVAPLISTHPLTQSVTKGTSRTLTVASSSGTELRYEWYQRVGATSVLMSGTSSSPNFPTPVVNENSTFYAKVYSGTASTPSNDAVLTLCAVSTVSSTASSSQVSGAVVRLSVDSPGTGETYQWYRGNSGDTSNAIPGGTLYFVDVYPLETTSYWVRTTRTGCYGDSATKTVNVCRPNISTQPASTTIANGSSTLLSVAATGTGPLYYEWYIGPPSGGGTLINGANQSTYPAAPAATTTYYARVTSSSVCGTRHMDSAPATVTVCNGPKIEYQDGTKQVSYNYYLTLQVTASGENLHYQWYEGPVGTTTKPVGQDSNQYSFYAGANATYWVSVSSTSCGSPVSSGPMAVHVNPHIQTQPVAATVCGSGGTATFTVQALNVHNYQWYRQITGQAAEMVGTNSPTLQIAVSQTPVQFWVVLTAGYGTTISNKVGATIYAAPTVNSFVATQATATQWQIKATVKSTDVNLVKYAFYEGQLGDMSKKLTDTTVSYLHVNPTATSRTFWVRVYYYNTAPYCYTDRVVTIP